MISISIVSHGHGEMVSSLVKQILECKNIKQIIVTLNIPENLELPPDNRIIYITNDKPKGFGANHNAAFRQSLQPWFVILNPDVILIDDPFTSLLEIANTTHVDILAPKALNEIGNPEDNWRQFPTLLSLTRKALWGEDGRYQTSKNTPFPVDWISGLCIFISQKAFKSINGFDEKYFMYYEDVDLCLRAWRNGYTLLACPNVKLIHNAQRASRHNTRHMRWHATSMLRYLLKYAGRFPRKS